MVPNTNVIRCGFGKQANSTADATQNSDASRSARIGRNLNERVSSQPNRTTQKREIAERMLISRFDRSDATAVWNGAPEVLSRVDYTDKYGLYPIKITDYVIKNASSGDLIITLGGGNVYKCANEIVKKLKNKK